MAEHGSPAMEKKSCKLGCTLRYEIYRAICVIKCNVHVPVEYLSSSHRVRLSKFSSA